MLSLLLVSMIAQDGEAVTGLRPLRLEAYRSGLIKLDGKPVKQSGLAARLRAARREARILCVWYEPKPSDGRPAFDFSTPAGMERFRADMRTTGIIAEASQTMPVFSHRDVVCQGGPQGEVDRAASHPVDRAQVTGRTSAQ